MLALVIILAVLLFVCVPIGEYFMFCTIKEQRDDWHRAFDNLSEQHDALLRKYGVGNHRDPN